MAQLLEVLAKLDGVETMLTTCQKRIDVINVKRLDERTSAIGSEMRLRKMIVHLRSKGMLHLLNDMDGASNFET